MSDNENTLVKDHWSGKGNIPCDSERHWWHQKDMKMQRITKCLTMRNTLVKDHWLQEYNFRVALKDQTKNKQSRKFDK